MEMTGFALPNHVFVCFAGDYCVFLDLRHDEYSCVRCGETRGFASVVKGWPDHRDPNAEREPLEDPDLASRLQELAETGLLVTDDGGGKEVRRVCVPRPAGTLLKDREMAENAVSIRPVDVARFLAASLSAASGLRWRRLEVLVSSVARRDVNGRNGSADPELGQVHDLVLRFRRMRPWFPRQFSCLFNSLALIDFLARYGVVANWVFGVRTVPFIAHCWVQFDDTLLDDSIEHVRSFTPIMAV